MRKSYFFFFGLEFSFEFCFDGAKLGATGRPRLVLGGRMLGEPSGSPLGEFLLLAKSAKGAACAQLVSQVLEHPSIHVFGELLDMPNVKEVRRQPAFCPT